MIEILKKNFISIAIVTLGIVLLSAAMIKQNPVLPFTMTTQEVLDDLFDFEHVLSSEVPDMLRDANQYVFVDLRSPNDFEKSHIQSAVNIPVANLLNAENIQYYSSWSSSDKTIVLYGQLERESLGPWMLLYRMGFGNTKVLMGGYDCYLEETADCPTTMARYDYAKISTQGGIKEVEVIKKKAVPKKKKAIPVQKKVKVEEEGGC